MSIEGFLYFNLFIYFFFSGRNFPQIFDVWVWAWKLISSSRKKELYIQAADDGGRIFNGIDPAKTATTPFILICLFDLFIYFFFSEMYVATPHGPNG